MLARVLPIYASFLAHEWENMRAVADIMARRVDKHHQQCHSTYTLARL